MRFVQLTDGSRRAAARVDGEQLTVLNVASIYQLALNTIDASKTLIEACEEAAMDERLEYDAIYTGRSPWRLLPSFDYPEDAAHCIVSGTGLTHKKGAENRSAMHGSEITDSMRMYQWGVEGGFPAPGKMGVQPEWFYKGDGSVLRAHGEELRVPDFAEDGGEEPEIAGAYVIGNDGTPIRVGWTTGNEFSDHVMERRNYLYLAHSKLRECAIGPELVVGEPFPEDLTGAVKILSNKATVWEKSIRSGQSNMCHSLDNLESHHFKYATHRRPGDVHIHFFGAGAFSFGDGIMLNNGDTIEVSFPAFGKALRNTVIVSRRPAEPVYVRAL